MHARIENDIAVEVISWDPAGRYPDGWVWVVCPDGTKQGATFAGGVFTNPVEVTLPEPEPTFRTNISRVEFKMLLTAPERLEIRAARNYEGADDAPKLMKAVLDDFYDIIDDTTLEFISLTSATAIEGTNYLEAVGLIGVGRAAELLAGIPE